MHILGKAHCRSEHFKDMPFFTIIRLLCVFLASSLSTRIYSSTSWPNWMGEQLRVQQPHSRYPFINHWVGERRQQAQTKHTHMRAMNKHTRTQEVLDHVAYCSIQLCARPTTLHTSAGIAVMHSQFLFICFAAHSGDHISTKCAHMCSQPSDWTNHSRLDTHATHSIYVHASRSACAVYGEVCTYT